MFDIFKSLLKSNRINPVCPRGFERRKATKPLNRFYRYNTPRRCQRIITTRKDVRLIQRCHIYTSGDVSAEWAFQNFLIKGSDIAIWHMKFTHLEILRFCKDFVKPTDFTQTRNISTKVFPDGSFSRPKSFLVGLASQPESLRSNRTSSIPTFSTMFPEIRQIRVPFVVFTDRRGQFLQKLAWWRTMWHL